MFQQGSANNYQQPRSISANQIYNSIGNLNAETHYNQQQSQPNKPLTTNVIYNSVGNLSANQSQQFNRSSLSSQPTHVSRKEEHLANQSRQQQYQTLPHRNSQPLYKPNFIRQTSQPPASRSYSSSYAQNRNNRHTSLGPRSVSRPGFVKSPYTSTTGFCGNIPIVEVDRSRSRSRYPASPNRQSRQSYNRELSSQPQQPAPQADYQIETELEARPQAEAQSYPPAHLFSYQNLQQNQQNQYQRNESSQQYQQQQFQHQQFQQPPTQKVQHDQAQPEQQNAQQHEQERIRYQEQHRKYEAERQEFLRRQQEQEFERKFNQQPLYHQSAPLAQPPQSQIRVDTGYEQQNLQSIYNQQQAVSSNLLTTTPSTAPLSPIDHNFSVNSVTGSLRGWAHVDPSHPLNDVYFTRHQSVEPQSLSSRGGFASSYPDHYGSVQVRFKSKTKQTKKTFKAPLCVNLDLQLLNFVSSFCSYEKVYFHLSLFLLILDFVVFVFFLTNY